MEVAVKAIETTGTINDQHQLVLDEPLPVAGPTRPKSSEDGIILVIIAA